MMNYRHWPAICAVAFAVSCAAPSSGPPRTSAQPAAPAALDEQRLTDIAATSDCARHRWNDRGRPKIGYIKGMALAYAGAYCEAKRDAESAAAAIGRPVQDLPSDALGHYGIGGSTTVERLRATYTLLIGLGMRESSGKTTEGRDMLVQHPTAENAEAGLFQVSFDSIGDDPWLRKLYSEYSGQQDACRMAVFMEGLSGEPEPDFGTGPGAEFQRFTKTCPAFAAEYAGVMIRVNARHFGPIRRREAEYLPTCQAMLEEVEQAAGCD